MFCILLALGGVQRLWAQTPTEEATPSGSISTNIEQQKLEIEKLKFENEKLKLEMEKVQLQATQTAVSTEKNKTSNPAATTTNTPQATPSNKTSDDVLKVFQTEESNKAEELAKANKDKENLLVLDLVNGEVWNKGVRYNIHELNMLAEDRGWKMSHTLKGRDAAGHGRIFYKFSNISLLKYDGRDRGVFKVTAPAGPEDFEILTPEGISLSSSSGDVRNAFQNMYFTYDREDHQGRLRVLRYNHSRGLAFSDKLEVAFDQQGQMAELRFGVLDER
jgi:regulator of replication initiation timing